METGSESRDLVTRRSVLAGGVGAFAGAALAGGLGGAGLAEASTGRKASAAAGGIASKYKNKTIGIVLLTLADENELVLTSAFQAAAKSAGLNWKFVVSDTQASNQQAQAALQSDVTRKVDMIVDCAIESRTFPAQLAQAKSAGIPVVGLYGFATPLDTEFAADYTAQGEIDSSMLTPYMMYDLQRRHPGAKTIKIAALDSPLDIIAIRRNVLAGLLPAFPNVKLVATDYNISLADTVGSTTTAVQGILQQHPDLAGIWVNYPPIAIAAAAAVAQQGKSKQVKVYAHVAESAGIKAVQNPSSALVATSWSDLVYSGYQVVQNALNVFARRPVSRFIDYTSPIPSCVLDASNAHQAVNYPVSTGAKVLTWMSSGGAYRQEFIEGWKQQFSK